MGMEMRRLCTICARGGSKGVPGKNLRQLLGKPLITHSISQARESGIFELLAVSSDSDEILAVAKENGVDILVKRPFELATDTAAKLPVIQHCVAEVEKQTGFHFNTLVDLDATSPLRIPEDIVGAVRLLEDSGASNVITGMPARRSPYFNLVEQDYDGIVHLSKPPKNSVVRRQDSPICFDMNASVYVWQHDVLFNTTSIFNPTTRLYVMPENRSIDIDSEVDFQFVEYLISKSLIS
jgi:N-acylneuraminate cytidylyltransferase/CMP-N,N'-diacetyllegionaminic acid synthase